MLVCLYFRYMATMMILLVCVPLCSHRSILWTANLPFVSIYIKDGSLCALDLLSVAGLVNYFGKQVEVDDIAIKPILLRKGTSRLALFGLGNVRDERLNRTFQRKKVRMFRPKDDGQGDWFNLMVLHQNRYSNFGSQNCTD